MSVVLIGGHSDTSWPNLRTHPAMLTPETAALALAIARGLFKLAGRMDALVAEAAAKKISANMAIVRSPNMTQPTHMIQPKGRNLRVPTVWVRGA